MFGIDKLKLLIKIEDVEIINENAFTKKIKGDELVELTYKQEKRGTNKIWWCFWFISRVRNLI
jgi:hypothetical protein